MTLSARSIAVQGVGAGVSVGIGTALLALAVQGFVPLAQPVVMPGDAAGAIGSGAHITRTEWLRRLQRRGEDDGAAGAHAGSQALAQAQRLALVRKRQRAEEEVILIAMAIT